MNQIARVQPHRRGAHHKGAANLTVSQGPQLPPSLRTSKEIRTADTATMCESLRVAETRLEPGTFRSRGDDHNHGTTLKEQT